MNIFRSCIGYLVHCLTPATFVHGCGLFSILRYRGILLLGHKGSGKTTVSRSIPHSYIIDDDQILIYENELVGIGRKAAHTVKRREAQNVVYETRGYRRGELGLVFRLTRDLPGGVMEPVSSASLLKDPELIWHHNLSFMEQPENYCEGKQVPDVPAFLVGTGGHKRETIEAVLRAMDDALKD